MPEKTAKQILDEFFKQQSEEIKKDKKNPKPIQELGLDKIEASLKQEVPKGTLVWIADEKSLEVIECLYDEIQEGVEEGWGIVRHYVVKSSIHCGQIYFTNTLYLDKSKAESWIDFLAYTRAMSLD